MLKEKRGFFALFMGIFAALVLAGCANMQKPIILDSDVSFGFGSAELTPAGKKQIDQYADSLRARGETRIEVLGHSDRIGDARANQVLSQRRAEAVRQQLIDARLDPELIMARGVGSTHPLVECNDRNQAALIACLAPNRRVEITVSDIRW